MMDTISLKNYRVIQKLGQGGMGVVYLAEDITLRRQVALKFLTPYLVRDPEIMKRFRAEARSQARLMHPHITMVYTFEEDGQQAFLVMEYVDGDTLEQRIKNQGKFHPRDGVAILGKVLGALDYAHARGVVHRDIKPANIGFTREGLVKLMDFGIALNFMESSRLTRTGHILGTPHYMAPEQILGKPLDARTDIYALGITLFEMLSGKLPFEGDSDYAVSLAQINDPPPSLLSLGYADINPAMEAAVFTALAKDPAARFATASDFLQALEAAVRLINSPPVISPPATDSFTQTLEPLGGQLISAPGPEATGTMAPSQPQRRVWRWVGSLGLAAGILTLTFFLLFSRPFHLMGWLSSGTVGQPGSSEKEPSLPETEKVLKAVTTSPTLTQPERVKAADHKQGEKTRGADAGPAAPSPQAKEKEAPKAVLVATLPPPPKVPAVPKKKEKEPPEFVDLTKAKLEEQGFSRIKVSLDEKERLIVAGQVKKASQRNEIISLVKSSGFPGKMDFSKLTVQQKVREKVVRPKVVREKPPGPVPTPIKPLGPKLD